MSFLNPIHQNKNILLRVIGVFSLLVLFFLFPKQVQATHIVGGEMGYKYLGDNKYQIFLYVYRDCETGQEGFDDPAYIGMYNGNRQLIRRYDVDFVAADTLSAVVLDECYELPEPVCVERTLYSIEITVSNDPVGGKYIFVYQRCCRNEGVQNINEPLETGAAYSVELTKLAIEKGNSTPTFKAWPPTFICLNEPINYDHGATDKVDMVNERIRYSLCTPYSAGTYNNPKPRPSIILPEFDTVYWNTAGGFSLENILGTNVDKIDIAESLTIDSLTGVLSGIPTIQGKFVVGICMEEFDEEGNLLSVVKRDFQYNVDVCSEAFVLTIDAAATCAEDLSSYSVDFSTNSPEVWVSAGNLTELSGGTYTVSDVPLDSTLRIRAIDEAINCILEEATLAPECFCESKPPVPVPVKTTNVLVCQGDPMPTLKATVEESFVVDWYDAPVGGNLLASKTDTFTPSQIGTYYAEGRRELDGCVSATREAVVLSLNEMPSVEVATEPVCSNDFSTYQVVFVASTTKVRVSQGTFSDMEGDGFRVADIPVDSSLAIFVSNNNETCEVMELVNRPDCSCDDVVINPPVVDTNRVAICDGDPFPTLSVQVEFNETVDWYDAPSGGNLLAAAMLTFTPDAAGIYYAEARNIGSGCKSATRTAIEVIINPVPDLELTGDGAQCEENFTEYQVSFRTNADDITLSRGNLIPLSPLDNRAINVPINSVLVIEASFSETGCSSTLTVAPPDCACEDFPVQAPVAVAPNVSICDGDPIPALVVTTNAGVTTDWYDSQSGGNLLASGVNNFVPSGAGTFFAEARKVANGCVSTTRTAVTLLVNPLPALSVIGEHTVCSSDLKFYSIEVSTSGDSISATAGMVSVLTSTLYKISNIPAGSNVEVTAHQLATGCQTRLEVLDPQCSCDDIVVDAPVALFSDTTICADETYPVLEVQVQAGETADWYGSAFGDDLLQAGTTTFLPPGAGIFYAQTRRTDTDCPSTVRTPVELTINPLPEVDVITNGILCSPDLLTYRVIFLTDGDVVSTSTGILEYDEDNFEYTVDGIPVGETLTIFSAISTTGCNMSFEVASPDCPCDPAIIDSPSVPDGLLTICAGEEVPSFNAFVGSGETVDWYGSPTGDDTVAIGTSSFDPVDSGTWYAETRISANGCVSAARTPVTLIVNPLPEVELMEDGLVCNPNLTTYSVSFHSSESSIQVTAGDLESIGGDRYRIKNIPVGSKVQIQVRDLSTGCENTLDIAAPDCPTCEDFIINPPGTSNSVISICEGDAIPSLQVIVQEGETVDWYTEAIGGELITTNTLGFKPPKAGTYYAETRVIVNGCTSTTRTPITLIINELPFITMIEGSAACAEDLLSYSIRFATNGDSINVSSGTVLNKGGGSYEVVDIPANRSINITAIFKDTGCKTTLAAQQPNCSCDNIVVDPPVIAADNFTICEGEVAPIFEATVEPGETVDWYAFPFGGTPIATDSRTFQPQEGGTYFAETRRYDTGCISTTRTPVTLTVLDLPSFSITAEGKICSEDVKTYSFSFQTNATKVTASAGELLVREVGLYELRGIPNQTPVTITLLDEITGCERIENVASADCPCDPTKVLPPFAVIDSFFICPGDPMPELEVLTESGEAIDWYATPTGGSPLAVNTPVFTPSTGGTYYAEKRLLAIDCVSATRTPVTVVTYELPAFEINIEGPQCAGDFETYSIAFTTDADLVDVSAGILQKISTGNYNVIDVPKDVDLIVYLTSSVTGCSTTGEVLSPGCDIDCREPYIFVPTAFSPNGDGNNDLYRVRSEIVESMRMVIYNRWGQEVYTLNAISETWDGTYRGRPLPPDVYGYYLKAVCYDGQVFNKQGNISLLR